jgi:hypothetical protein
LGQLAARVPKSCLSPSQKFPSGAPRVLGTADRCMMLILGGFWLVRLRRLDPANNVIQYMLCGANTRRLVCCAGVSACFRSSQACKRITAIVCSREHAFRVLRRRCTIAFISALLDCGSCSTRRVQACSTLHASGKLRFHFSKYRIGLACM